MLKHYNDPLDSTYTDFPDLPNDKVGNVKLIETIKFAEEIFLKEAIGAALYYNLKLNYNVIGSKYKELFDGKTYTDEYNYSIEFSGIRAYLVRLTMQLYLSNNQFWTNIGSYSPNTDNSKENIEKQKQMKLFERGCAGYLLDKINSYLLKFSTDFPEWTKQEIGKFGGGIWAANC